MQWQDLKKLPRTMWREQARGNMQNKSIERAKTDTRGVFFEE
jgi:hypothetical protein